MAPPPEYDKEPKAPDKNLTTISADDPKILNNHVKEQPTNIDFKIATAAGGACTEVENNKHVEALDDGQLRALLDEAITYKCPKDREGKSSLFKELLEEVEQDEQACEEAARGAGGGRQGRRDRRREHHSSLQDLVAAMAGEPAPRRGRAPAAIHVPPSANVSARTHHGGSLPSGVDTSFLLSEEGCSRGSYLATVHVVNPPPLGERRVSASDAHPPATDSELVSRRSKPVFPMTYTARATLEIGSGSVGSGRAVTTTTASNQVDSAIPFGCITSPEVVGCSTVATTSQSATIDPKPRSILSSNFNGLPLTRPVDDYKVPILTVHYRLQKSLDENGNAVQGSNSPVSGSNQPKKTRRKRVLKNETVITSHQIDGYQGNKDLKELLRFIESNDDGGRSKLRVKHKDDSDDKAAKKRSSERRKDKDAKPKRASSLEELSRTKLEDLTDKPTSREEGAERRRAQHAPAKPERRSWGDDARALLYRANALGAPPADGEAPLELTDFQTVTKKKKPRKRTDDGERDNENAQRRARASPDGRAAAAPPSDRSNDSNDDMDSVHSLPAMPQRPPPPPPLPPPPQPPHASYADIARTRHNIPDLIESCNFYSEGESEAGGPAASAACGDADQYPALVARRARDKRPTPTQARDKRKEPDVVADRRPAVVLLDSPPRAPEMDGVTFGFDINEQLLGGTRRARCDLLRDAPEEGVLAPPPPPPPPPPLSAPPLMPLSHAAPIDRTEPDQPIEPIEPADPVDPIPSVAPPPSSLPAPSALLAAPPPFVAPIVRYVPPNPLLDTSHLHQIVDYVSKAWDEAVRCGSGKVVFYSE